MRSSRLRQRLGLWAFVVASLALTIWAVATYINPTTDCRGERMGPGDVCHYSSTSEVETDQVQRYEDRIAIVRQQVPFVIGVGAIATAFGVVLLVRSGRDGGSGHEGHGAVDDPVLLHERCLGDAGVDEVREEQ